MKWPTGKYTNGFMTQQTDRKGKPWKGTLKYRDDAGAWHQISKTFDVETLPANSKKKVIDAALDTWRNEMEAEAAKEARAAEYGHTLDVSRTTVAEYVSMCIDDMQARGTVERSTIADYRFSSKYLHNGSAPIGNEPMDKLTRGDVERWETGLLEEGTSAVVVGKVHRLLRQCMRRAAAMDDLPKDPTLGVKPPKRPSRQPNALDAAGRARVTAMLDTMQPTPLKVGIALAMYAGMRQGEVCGLRWKNVDLDAGTIWVRESIGYAEGGAYTKDPKTSSSKRDIPIVPQLAEILRERRTQMVTECLDPAKPVPFSGDLYVLGYPSGEYYGGKTLGREWAALAKAYNITGTTGKRVTFHDLRHTFATAAIAAGVDVKTVSSILGHANAAMTLNIYASADPDAKRQAAIEIGKAFDQEPPTPNVLTFGKTGTDAE